MTHTIRADIWADAITLGSLLRAYDETGHLILLVGITELQLRLAAYVSAVRQEDGTQ